MRDDQLLVCVLQILKVHGVDFIGKAEQQLEHQRRPMAGVADNGGGTAVVVAQGTQVMHTAPLYSPVNNVLGGDIIHR